jgi:DNA-binding beta-propeller fold protein YncE
MRSRVRLICSLLVLVALGLVGRPSPVSAIPLAPGDLLVTDVAGPTGVDKIIRVDPVSGEQTVITSGGLLGSPVGIALDANGQILAINQEGSGGAWIVRVDPATGSQTPVTSGGLFSRGIGLALDDSGNIFASDDAIGIIMVDPLTGSQSLLSSGSFWGITFDNAGDLVATDNRSQALLRVDPTNGSQTLISSGGAFKDPLGVVTDLEGNIFVSDVNNPGGGDSFIVRVDPVTGAQTTIFGPDSSYTAGLLAIDDTGQIIAPNQHFTLGPPRVSGVLSIDPDTGLAVTLSSGGEFFDAVGVVIVPIPEPSTALLLALGLAGLAVQRRRRAL